MFPVRYVNTRNSKVLKGQDLDASSLGLGNNVNNFEDDTLFQTSKKQMTHCVSGNQNSVSFLVGITLKNWVVSHPCLMKIPAHNKNWLIQNAVLVSAWAMKFLLLIHNFSGFTRCFISAEFLEWSTLSCFVLVVSSGTWCGIVQLQ